MKALALRQPWAELVVSGRKTIEVRSKQTNYRGWFYVYASHSGTKDAVLHRFGFTQLPTGIITGKAFLKDVKRYKSDAELYRDGSLHLATKELLQLEGWTSKKRYGYIIADVERMTPIPYRGMPGFFPVRVSHRIEKLCRNPA